MEPDENSLSVQQDQMILRNSNQGVESGYHAPDDHEEACILSGGDDSLLEMYSKEKELPSEDNTYQTDSQNRP